MVYKSKRHLFWNLLIGVALIVVLLAFTAHYKNWVTIKNDHFRVLSGIYYKQIRFSKIDTVTMVEKIPHMERINGFSAMTMEKGVFKDSITQNTVHVYVDNLVNPKIKMVYQDSLRLYLNFSDSTETRKMYELFKTKMAVDLK